MKVFTYLFCSLTLLGGSLNAQALPLGSQPDPTMSTGVNGSYLDWQGVAGRTYFMQYSLDLENWDYLQDIEQGQGELISYLFQSSSTAMHLRLHYADIQVTNPGEADFDLDGYTNAYEVQNGMDPLQFNTGGTPGNPMGSTPSPTGTPPTAGAAYQLLIETTEDGNAPVVQTIDLNEDLEIIAVNGQLGGSFPFGLAIDSTDPHPFKIKVMLKPVAPLDEEEVRLKLLEYQKYNPDPVSGVPQPLVEKLVDWPELVISPHQQNPYFEITEEISGTAPVRNLLPVGIIPDYNRDGRINSQDRGKVTKANPWRFWVNDDDDITNEERKDEGVDIPGGGRRDSDDLVVDGIRDLVDFFPLHLDLKTVLQILPKEAYTYRLKHDEGMIKFHEIIETKLENDHANSGPLAYLKNVAKSRSLKLAALKRANETGVALSIEILEAFEKGEGILICEAAGKTSKPLRLEILKNDGTSLAEVLFPIKISGVEDMFRGRYLNENLDGGTQGGVPGEPSNWPDADRNGKHFIFVHGYNVSGDQARGWHSEAFKRLFFSGSNAMFTGVSWHGNESQIAGATADYWRNVHNAFQTSKSVADFVNALPGSGEKYIAAHSLGNVVVSSAIKDHGLQVTQYYMVDAAAPLEAYSPGTSHKDKMSHPDWRGYEQRAWSTDYHKLFEATDGRHQLTWIDRFSAFPYAYNFHSTGEEVLKNGDGTVPGTGGVILSGGELAWVKNEMSKGFILGGSGGGVLHNATGGWDFNEEYLIGGSIRPSSETVAALSNATLQVIPVFEEFEYGLIFSNHPKPGGGGESWGSITARDYDTRAEILAEMLPALSFAAGSNPIDSFDSPQEDRNFNMMTMKNDWIMGGGDADWKHSDIRDVAYLYTRRVYEKFVELGDLN